MKEGDAKILDWFSKSILQKAQKIQELADKYAQYDFAQTQQELQLKTYAYDAINHELQFFTQSPRIIEILLKYTEDNRLKPETREQLKQAITGIKQIEQIHKATQQIQALTQEKQHNPNIASELDKQEQQIKNQTPIPPQIRKPSFLQKAAILIGAISALIMSGCAQLPTTAQPSIQQATVKITSEDKFKIIKQNFPDWRDHEVEILSKSSLEADKIIFYGKKIKQAKIDAYVIPRIIYGNHAEDVLYILDKISEANNRGENLDAESFAISIKLWMLTKPENISFCKSLLDLDIPVNIVRTEDLTKQFEGFTIEQIKALKQKAKSELNMDHFYRFTPSDLTKLIRNKEKLNKGILGKDRALLLVPKSDWNGAFSGEMAMNRFHKIIQAYSDILCFEIATDTEMAATIKLAGEEYPIEFLIVAGHGSQTTLAFADIDPRIHGSRLSEEYSLGFEDREELLNRKLDKFLSQNAIVLSLSCSTGQGGKQAANEMQNLAGLLRDTLKRTTYASKEPLIVGMVQLEFDEKTKKVRKIILTEESNTLVLE